MESHACMKFELMARMGINFYLQLAEPSSLFGRICSYHHMYTVLYIRTKLDRVDCVVIMTCKANETVCPPGVNDFVDANNAYI